MVKKKILIPGVILLLITAGSIFATRYLPNRLVEEVVYEIGQEEPLNESMFFLHPTDTGTFVTDISTIDLNVLGEYDIEIDVDNYLSYESKLKVVDTTIPEVVVKDINIGFGAEPKPEDFIVSATDNTELSHSFKTSIDTSKDSQELTIITKDIAGNTVENVVKLTYFQIKTEIEAELGQTNQITAELFIPQGVKNIEIELKTTPEELKAFKLGENIVLLNVDGKEVQAKVNVIDTIAPTAEPNSITLLKGHSFDANSFVKNIVDADKVSVSFKGSKPIVEKTGEYTVIIILKDSSGNTTELPMKYKVLIDETAPVIHGVSDKTIIAKENYNLLSGVSATDDIDGSVRVTVDTSKLNDDKAGTYTVIYKTKDKAGNETTKEGKVTVREREKWKPKGDTGSAQLNALVDGILSNLLHNEMSQRQIVEKI